MSSNFGILIRMIPYYSKKMNFLVAQCPQDNFRLSLLEACACKMDLNDRFDSKSQMMDCLLASP